MQISAGIQSGLVSSIRVNTMPSSPQRFFAPASLELLPGEVAQPPLRLLERRRAAPRHIPAARGVEAATAAFVGGHWLSRLAAVLQG